MNFFIVNGHIPAIVATCIAKSHYFGENNVLVKERPQVNLVSNRYKIYSENYNSISNILCSYFSWDEVIDIKIKRTVYVNDDTSKDSWERRTSVRIETHNLDEVMSAVKTGIPKLSSKDRIISGDNSNILNYLNKSQAQLCFFEHGTALYGRDYFEKEVSIRKLKRNIRHMIPWFKNNYRPQKVYLTDRGESSAYRKYKKMGSDVEVISIDCRKIIKDLFSFFQKTYSCKFSKDYEEIMDIKKKMDGFKNKYIYLPSVNVALEEYDQYFKDQFNGIEKDDAVFLIKSHPRDNAQFAEYFKRNGYQSLEIKSQQNKSIPAELLMYLLDYPTLFGSYSSCLCYAYWWLDQVPLFKEVESYRFHQSQIKEYTGTYDDLQELVKKYDRQNREN